MFDNLKNKLKGIATEKQFTEDDGEEVCWRRDTHGNMIDQTGKRVAGNLEKERVLFNADD